MPASGLSRDNRRQTQLKPETPFQRPANCPVSECPAISMYEQELRRHRATESKLRETLVRERALLQQKEESTQQIVVLARESEHRLLNGLQLITSLLAVQSRRSKNPDTTAELNIAANRIATLARVHRHLHTLDNVESIEFKRYLEKLCNDLFDMVSGDTPERSISIKGTELNIPSATAIPLGFIASELITNSIKYANGNVTIDLSSTPNGDCTLSVSDDGPGLPAAFDPMATPGLGMKIIAALTRQINGELHIAKGDHGQGTKFSVTFKPQGTRS